MEKREWKPGFGSNVGSRARMDGDDLAMLAGEGADGAATAVAGQEEFVWICKVSDAAA